MSTQDRDSWSLGDQDSNVTHRRSLNNQANNEEITVTTLNSPQYPGLHQPRKTKTSSEVTIELSSLGESVQPMLHGNDISHGCISNCFHQYRVDPLRTQSFTQADDLHVVVVTRPQRLRAEEELSRGALDLQPAPRYFHTHLDCLYYICMVPYKRNNIFGIGGRTSGKIFAYYLQKVRIIFFCTNIIVKKVFVG